MAICRSASASARRTRAATSAVSASINVLGQRQFLLEAGAGQAGAFFGLGDRLFRHAEPLVGGLEVEAGLLDFEVERETQLALLLAGGFKIGVGLPRPWRG